MTDNKKYTLTRYACYLSNFSMSAVASISPLLFVTFREMYHISYTLLGLLVVINFSTQLFVDLLFTFFTRFFNIKKTLKAMPLITLVGFLIYALMPALFPHMAYMWICIGTIVFSVSSGLSEVLISPVIAAIPSDNPDGEMSKLHSVYAWGVVAVVVVSTLILHFIGKHNWMYLALLWTLVPAVAAVLFGVCNLPDLNIGSGTEGRGGFFNKGLIMCVICIFLGGASECTMAQWVSGFLEKAVSIPKLWGDIFGMALFSVCLGTGRSMYAKHGKNILPVLKWGMAGAFVCYVVSSVIVNPLLNVVACALTGLCVSMLWPGSLIYMEENIPGVGVAAFAMMAAGGDFGASVAPQLVGYVSDVLAAAPAMQSFGASIGISAEQIGMRCGMLLASAFPLCGVALLCAMSRKKVK